MKTGININENTGTYQRKKLARIGFMLIFVT